MPLLGQELYHTYAKCALCCCFIQLNKLLATASGFHRPVIGSNLYVAQNLMSTYGFIPTVQLYYYTLNTATGVKLIVFFPRPAFQSTQHSSLKPQPDACFQPAEALLENSNVYTGRSRLILAGTAWSGSESSAGSSGAAPSGNGVSVIDGDFFAFYSSAFSKHTETI